MRLKDFKIICGMVKNSRPKREMRQYQKKCFWKNVIEISKKKRYD